MREGSYIGKFLRGLALGGMLASGAASGEEVRPREQQPVAAAVEGGRAKADESVGDPRAILFGYEGQEQMLLSDTEKLSLLERSAKNDPSSAIEAIHDSEPVVARNFKQNSFPVLRFLARLSDNRSISAKTKNVLTKSASFFDESISAAAVDAMVEDKQMVRQFLDQAKIKHPENKDKINTVLVELAMESSRSADAALARLAQLRIENPELQEAVDRKAGEEVLETIKKLNEDHAKKSTERFKKIRQLPLGALKMLLVESGRDSMYTSTFKEIKELLLKRMGEEGVTGEKILEGLSEKQLENFLQNFTRFGVLNEFLPTLAPEAQVALVEHYTNSIDLKDMNEAIKKGALAVNVVKSFKIQKNIFDKEMRRAEEMGDKKRQSFFATLSRLAISGDQAPLVVKGEMVDFENLRLDSLRNERGEVIQQAIFLPGEESAFRQFVDSFKKQGWTSTEYNHALVLESQTEVKQKIYVTKPMSSRNDGIAETNRLMTEAGERATVVQVRGESMDITKDIGPFLPNFKDAKVILIGSCNGNNTRTEIVKYKPMAHIVATESVGHTRTNNEIAFKLSGMIGRGEGTINWGAFQADLEQKLGSDNDFKYYVFANDVGQKLQLALQEQKTQPAITPDALALQ